MQYDDLNWHICANFKFVAMQISLQLGYTNFCCILCLWNSRAKAHHMYARIGRSKIKLSKENNNIKYKPLVKNDRIFLLPSHIKLSLFKQFVKALDKKSSAFVYLAEKFPSLSQAKIKEGVFIGPKI